jgi:leucyl-tRNA synthetase
LILLSPYAPHISEELYQQIKNFEPGSSDGASVLNADFPQLEKKYLIETSKEYPISINGKLRTQIPIHLNASQEEVEQVVLANPVVQKWIEGKPLKKLIYVKGKMVNVVV